MTILYVKFLVSMALFMAFYWVVLRNKAGYGFRRAYLLAAPIVCVLMSTLAFGVYPVEVEPEEMAYASDLVAAPVVGKPADVVVMSERVPVKMSNEVVEPVVEDSWSWSDIDWSAVVGYLVPAISLILLLVALFYFVKLVVIKSRMRSEMTEEGYEIIRSSSVKTPFSFAKTIFCPSDLDENSESLIMRHEKAHIAHRHYVDVWVIEVLTRVFWFNPLIWLCRSELRDVHEFEADHDVIASGASILKYQTTLLEMVLNENCPVVNGFSHSFIRRRFIEMKTSAAGTLGRVAKIGVFVWAAALFCMFTFEECAPKTSDKVKLDLDAPQKFVLEGTVDAGITDSCYLVYISDEYLHIPDTTDICIPVVDKKFHFEMDLQRVTAARVRCIFPGGEVCSAFIDYFMVPGETLYLNVHNGYYDFRATDGFNSKIERGMEALRKMTNWESPHLPKFDCPMWSNPSQVSRDYSRLHVKDVYFDKDETVVRLVSDQHTANMNIPSTFFLKDNKGNAYKFKRAVMGNVEDNNGKECRAYGVYLAYEPMPADVESFNIMCPSSDNSEIVWIENVRKASSMDNLKPNFELTITTESGIDDSGYLIRMFNVDGYSATQIADLTNDRNRQSHFAMNLDETKTIEVVATYPDGSISQRGMVFPFVPGERAELKVMGDRFELTGTGFYKEWAKADEAVENLTRYASGEEQSEKLKAYYKDHADNLGVVVYFMMHRNLVSMDDVIENMPEAIGADEFVKKAKERYQAEKQSLAAYEAERALRQKDTQPGMMFKDFAVKYEGKTQRLSDYVGKGKYVLVDFWASWCGPCRMETPNVIKVWEKYAGNRFEVVGIATWDEPEDTKRAIEEEGIKYPQIMNAQSVASDLYGVMGIPEFILFGPDGKIVERGMRGEEIELAVKKALGE
ncbi:MAG: redoxin domain-containing protein [Bacteroidales bacterium]|nr:redoxin domain-containing protein [Bacteroidales bacterium]